MLPAGDDAILCDSICRDEDGLARIVWDEIEIHVE